MVCIEELDAISRRELEPSRTMPLFMALVCVFEFRKESFQRA